MSHGLRCLLSLSSKRSVRCDMSNKLKKNESRVAPARRGRVHMRITFKPCDVRERMQSFTRARAKSFVGAPWRRVFVVAALTRKNNSLAFARHLPPNQPILRGAQHAQNTLACAQTALGSGRCAHLSAPCARDSTLHLHRHRAYLRIHIQTGTSHPTPRGQTLRCLGLMDSPGIERTRNSAAL